MRIAVVNEISTSARHPVVMEALMETGHEVFNVGMTDPSDKPELTYLQTGLISALLINLDLADMIIGGCGTGQGYMNSVIQYPGITCALITEPLDAWLARRINAPNCISLALNKGFGWAGNINLKLIAEALFAPSEDKGYPPERAESQTNSRELLKSISKTAHRPMVEIMKDLDESIVAPIYKCKAFCDLLPKAADCELKAYLIEQIEKGQN